MIGVVSVDRGEEKRSIHHDALLRFQVSVMDNERRSMEDRTYQRVWPLVMAHSNGAPFLLFDVARRFVRAHASFIRSSTVSVCVNGQRLSSHIRWMEAQNSIPLNHDCVITCV